MRKRIRAAVALAVALASTLALAAAAAADNGGSTVVYDSFSAPGGYTLANYEAKWSNIYGLGDMAASCLDGTPTLHGDTRLFGGGVFSIADAPFSCGYDYSVYDHLKYIAVSSQSFPVPQVGSLEFDSDISAQTPGTQPGRVIHGAYGRPGSCSALPCAGTPWSAATLQGQQAGAVMNMINFATGQLFDWFVSGDTAFALIERLPSAVTGSSSPSWVGPEQMYTQIIAEYPATAGVAHHVGIRYTRERKGDFVSYYLDGTRVAKVANVGIPLDRQGVNWTGTYPSLGPGELLQPNLNSFVIGHGTFSLLDAFPFQWGWTPDPTLAGSSPCVDDYAVWPTACDASVSIPVSERLFGQGVDAAFDNFTVTTRSN